MSRHGRIDDSQVGEPAAHKAPVAGDERIGALQRMCADEEVRDDGKPQEYTAGAYTVKRHLPAAGNPFSAITSPGTAGSPMTAELKLSKLKRGSF